MIGTCIIAIVFSPILAEFLAYFNHDCRGFLRSDKTMDICSLKIEPRTFRAIAFILIFVILYPTLRWLAGGNFSWRADLGFVVSYLCFMEVIEAVIIYINKDDEAKTTPKEPFPDWFSMKARMCLMGMIIVIAACADSLLWNMFFKKPLERNPAAYGDFVKKIPNRIKKQALWFLRH